MKIPKSYIYWPCIAEGMLELEDIALFDLALSNHHQREELQLPQPQTQFRAQLDCQMLFPRANDQLSLPESQIQPQVPSHAQTKHQPHNMSQNPTASRSFIDRKSDNSLLPNEVSSSFVQSQDIYQDVSAQQERIPLKAQPTDSNNDAMTVSTCEIILPCDRKVTLTSAAMKRWCDKRRCRFYTVIMAFRPQQSNANEEIKSSDGLTHEMGSNKYLDNSNDASMKYRSIADMDESTHSDEQTVFSLHSDLLLSGNMDMSNHSDISDIGFDNNVQAGGYATSYGDSASSISSSSAELSEVAYHEPFSQSIQRINLHQRQSHGSVIAKDIQTHDSNKCSTKASSISEDLAELRYSQRSDRMIENYSNESSNHNLYNFIKHIIVKSEYISTWFLSQLISIEKFECCKRGTAYTEYYFNDVEIFLQQIRFNLHEIIPSTIGDNVNEYQLTTSPSYLRSLSLSMELLSEGDIFALINHLDHIETMVFANAYKLHDDHFKVIGMTYIIPYTDERRGRTHDSSIYDVMFAY